MNKDKSLKDISIMVVKDTLKQGLYKWSDTGNLVTYTELLNVIGLKEPLSLDQAKQMYSSLTSDSRIIKI